MLGIPDWGIAVGVIILFGSAGIVLIVRLLPPEMRRHPLTDQQQQRLEDLEARVGELDAVKERVGQLEERADFAERLLARQREGQRVGPTPGE